VQLDELDYRVVKTFDLSAAELDSVHKLFGLSYEKPNHAYLNKSLAQLSYVALAYRGKKIVCFAVGDVIESSVPGISGPQIIHMGGISCISPDFRRMGLFRNLQMLIADETGLIKPDTRVITCGRMAHPASARIITSFPGAIPKNGVILSGWQKEVGVCLSGLYGATIDAETFVVKGDGTPIGYPKVDIVATDEEWELFEKVDRDRGDSLLFVAWYPHAPEGW
jgi:hypothetical protein